MSHTDKFGIVGTVWAVAAWLVMLIYGSCIHSCSSRGECTAYEKVPLYAPNVDGEMVPSGTLYRCAERAAGE